jgi:5-methylcytosine-specific restriction endonuclease McrA
MLEHLPNARAKYTKGMMGGKGRLILDVGSTSLVWHYTKAEYEALRETELTEPVPLGAFNGRCYWSFRSWFYAEPVGLTAKQVHALIVAAEMEQQARWKRQVDRAQAMVAQGPRDSAMQRTHISVEIRKYVFERDGGRCVNCDSKNELQTDHIIPLKLGGSSEPENLQILCAPCNRRKGASLG